MVLSNLYLFYVKCSNVYLFFGTSLTYFYIILFHIIADGRSTVWTPSFNNLRLILWSTKNASVTYSFAILFRRTSTDQISLYTYYKKTINNLYKVSFDRNKWIISENSLWFVQHLSFSVIKLFSGGMREHVDK